MFYKKQLKRKTKQNIPGACNGFHNNNKDNKNCFFFIALSTMLFSFTNTRLCFSQKLKCYCIIMSKMDERDSLNS